jgi:hypothetical protein
MTTGLGKFKKSSRLNVNMVSFKGLVTIRNGVVSEDVSPDSKIYQRYVIGVKEFNWDILVMETKTHSKYMIISRDGYVLGGLRTELTTTDLEEMEYYRDLVLCEEPDVVLRE